MAILQFLYYFASALFIELALLRSSHLDRWDRVKSIVIDRLRGTYRHILHYFHWPQLPDLFCEISYQISSNVLVFFDSRWPQNRLTFLIVFFFLLFLQNRNFSKRFSLPFNNFSLSTKPKKQYFFSLSIIILTS